MTQVDITAKASVNYDAPRTRLFAGVSVADNPLITAVIEYARRISEPYLFNHAMRSWLFAETIGRIKGIDYDHEVVAIGTVLHDIGLTASVSGPNRFEVNGADAALSFIKCEGISDRRAQLIWDSTTAASALRHFRRVMSNASSALSPPGDEASIYRGVLSARHGKARDESRQLPARLRRAVRAWLQGRVNG
jgi:hypothetical protein